MEFTRQARMRRPHPSAIVAIAVITAIAVIAAAPARRDAAFAVELPPASSLQAPASSLSETVQPLPAAVPLPLPPVEQANPLPLP